VEAAFLTGQPTAQSAFYNPRLKQTVVYSYDLSAMKQVKVPFLSRVPCAAHRCYNYRHKSDEPASFFLLAP
jgi:hypothetical protein